MNNEINFVMKLCFHLFSCWTHLKNPGLSPVALVRPARSEPARSTRCVLNGWPSRQAWVFSRCEMRKPSAPKIFSSKKKSLRNLEICLTNLKLAKQIGCENLTKSLPTKTRHRFLICACLEICPKILRNLWRLIWLREWRLEGENAMASTEDTSESLCSLRSFKGVVYIVRKYYIYISIYIYIRICTTHKLYVCIYMCDISIVYMYRLRVRISCNPAMEAFPVPDSCNFPPLSRKCEELGGDTELRSWAPDFCYL